ncbi:MAG: DUF805 domain-containing protein [Lonepinella koalarum]|nr:DUF805 domain-containing protein [Lonepinella koalarum]
MSENNLFYYENNGANMGPVSSDEIIELAKNGTLNRNSLIWREGYEDWKKLSESEIDVSFLPPPMKQTPPPMKSNSSAGVNIASLPKISGDNVFIQYFVGNFKNYINFKGRARRKEFWFFSLFYFLIYLGLSIIEGVFSMLLRTHYIGVLPLLFGLASIIPSLGLSFRRLHDTDRSAWWLLLHLIPLIGSIVIIIFCCLDSQAGENRYGANPKEQDLA